MTKLDDWTLSLITNEEIIAVDQASSGNHQLFNRDGFIAWIADVPDSKDKYLAVFNTRGLEKNEPAAPVPVPVKFKELDFTGACKVRDLWQGKDLGEFEGEFAPRINSHGAGIYRVSASEP
jgi:hypothetical protein